MSGYREKCLDAKGEECHFCDATSNILVHHIDGNRENNHMSNLLPVCRGCHGKIHSGTLSVDFYHRRLRASARSFDRTGGLPDDEFYCNICDEYVQDDEFAHDAVEHPDALRQAWFVDDFGRTRAELEREIERAQKANQRTPEVAND